MMRPIVKAALTDKKRSGISEILEIEFSRIDKPVNVSCKRKERKKMTPTFLTELDR